MKFPHDIRNLIGFSGPNNILDPAVYPEKELDEDLIEIDFEMREIRREIQDVSQEYDQKIEEIAAAPEWKKEYLLREADEIENHRKDKVAIYSHRHNLQMLIKAIRGTRERLNVSGEQLHIHNRLQATNGTEIKRVLKEQLREKGLNQKKLTQITDTMSDARDRELDNSGSSDRSLEKHRKRAERAASTPPDGGSYLDDEPLVDNHTSPQT